MNIVLGCSRGLPLRYVRDLRPLTAIPLLAGDTPPLHPPTNQEFPPFALHTLPHLAIRSGGVPLQRVVRGASWNPPLRPPHRVAQLNLGGPPASCARRCGRYSALAARSHLWHAGTTRKDSARITRGVEAERGGLSGVARQRLAAAPAKVAAAEEANGPPSRGNT